MADGPPPVNQGAIDEQAAGEVGADINAQIAPFQAQVGQLQGQEHYSLDVLGKMFPGLLEASAESSKRLESFYGDSMNFESQIFGAANKRLNDFRQSRAAEAQTLAQEMGAPVPMAEFTYSADAAQDQAGNQFKAQLLHSLGYATAGVGEVEAWSGKVFPLIQKEETDRTIKYFQSQIDETNKRIAEIKAGAPAAIRTRSDELRMQQQQHNLDVWKAKKDYALSQQQIADEKARIKQDEENLRIQKAQTLGYYEEWYRDSKGNARMRKVPTLGSRQLGADVSAKNKDRDLSRQQLQLEKDKEALAEKEIGQKNSQYAGSLLDAATHPTSGTKTVTRSTKVYIYRTGVDKGAPPQKYDGKDDVGYFNIKDIKSVVNTTGASIHDPNKAYDYLLNHGVDNATAVSTIRRQFGLGNDWQPNHTYTWTMQKLHQLDFTQLRNIALSLGFKPDPKKPRTGDYLRSWILGHQKKRK